MIDWKTELPKIKLMAEAYNVDWRFLCAIRNSENGGPGKEFGVLSVPAPTYGEQLRIAASSVSHRLTIYCRDVKAAGLPYSDDFIHYFANIWAPQEADNDPLGLNANWDGNCASFYAKICGGWTPQ